MSNRPDLYKSSAEHQLSLAATLIQAMIPFLDKKATESGDVAGLRANAQQFLNTPMIVSARTVDYGYKELIEAAAHIAENGCLVPPDGGSPTEAEREMCKDIANSIRRLA